MQLIPFTTKTRLSAMNMILLKLSKYNKNFKKCIEKYLKLINFGYIECPHCHSTEIIRWGFYERNVIFFGTNNKLESLVIKVQRVRCKSCLHTHALLPFGIIPYKQFSDEVISKVLNDVIVLDNSLEEVSEKYLIDDNTIKSWIKEFKNKHLSRVSILVKCNNIKKMYQLFLKNDINKECYLYQYSKCFMQNKLLILLLNSS